MYSVAVVVVVYIQFVPYWLNFVCVCVFMCINVCHQHSAISFDQAVIHRNIDFGQEKMSHDNQTYTSPPALGGHAPCC